MATNSTTVKTSAKLPRLPHPVACATTETAQRFLDAAKASVDSALSALAVLRSERGQGTQLRGRLTDSEEDLLRAAVIFAGAGLDASLKQLIRDALGPITEVNADAQSRFRSFASKHVSGGDLGVSPERLVDILLDDNHPWDAFLEAYIRQLTGDSLQSASQVANVCTAIGFTEGQFRKRIKAGSELDLMFRARNQMIHELDLEHDKESGPGVRMKRGRKIQASVEMAHEALAVAQEIINAAGTEISRADLT